MRLLVRQYILPLHLVQSGRQIDARFYDAENERRGDGITKVDIFPHTKRYAYTPPQPQVTHECVSKHRREADEPRPACDICPRVERVDVGCRHGGKMLAERGIHCVVDDVHAARDGWRRVKLHDRGTDRFGTGNQAQSTFDGKWQHKPQRDDAPEQDIHPLGGAL